MLELTETVKYTSQSMAISLQQSPGVARSLWPSGDDISRTYQIGQLQEQVSNISVELSDSLGRGLRLLMTDVPTFVEFADNGRYSNNNPPLDPNSIKNELAITLQTYLVSESTKQNAGTPFLWESPPKRSIEIYRTRLVKQHCRIGVPTRTKYLSNKSTGVR